MNSLSGFDVLKDTITQKHGTDMIYEYQCTACDHEFEVYKSVKKYKEPEPCNLCGGKTKRILSLSNVNPVEHGEFNHGLGCWVNDKKHRAEVAKQKGMIEVGNEATETVHKDAETTLKQNLSWDNVI